jgi:hypothetical protein
MIKTTLLCALTVATVASPAFAMKNYQIQTNSYGTEYTYWCDEGHIVKFSLGHNISIKQKFGFNTLDEYLASRNCS